MSLQIVEIDTGRFTPATNELQDCFLAERTRALRGETLAIFIELAAYCNRRATTLVITDGRGIMK